MHQNISFIKILQCPCLMRIWPASTRWAEIVYTRCRAIIPGQCQETAHNVNNISSGCWALRICYEVAIKTQKKLLEQDWDMSLDFILTMYFVSDFYYIFESLIFTQLCCGGAQSAENIYWIVEKRDKLWMWIFEKKKSPYNLRKMIPTISCHPDLHFLPPQSLDL